MPLLLAAEEPGPVDASMPIWLLVVTIVGLVAALITIWVFVGGRSRDRMLRKLVETAVDEARAEDARQRAGDAKAELSAIRRALEELQSAAPQIARQMHAESRMEQLAIEVGERLDEYESLGQVAGPGEIPLSGTASRLVEDVILPAYRARSSHVRNQRLLLIVIVILLVLPYPFTPSVLVRGWAVAAIIPITDPPALDDLGGAQIWAALWATVAGLFAGGLFVLVERFRGRSVSVRWIPMIFTSVLLVAINVFGFILNDPYMDSIVARPLNTLALLVATVLPMVSFSGRTSQEWLEIPSRLARRLRPGR